MLFADTSLSFDPSWPWSLPTLGLPALVGAALMLALLTLWTYLGVKNATFRRIGIVLLLRLAALAIVFSMMMRPSLAVTQLEGVEMTKLLVVVDASSSMSAIEKEGEPSRWEQVTKLWASRDVQRRLEQLRAEQKIEVVKYLAAEDLRLDDPGAAATGKRTDIGAWLHQLFARHGHDKHLRGIVLLSDGADNGLQFSAADKARAWRGIAPLHAFGVGDPDNPKFKKDIAPTRLSVKPELVFVRSKLTVEAAVQAAGYKDAEVTVSVALDGVSIPSTKHRIKQEKDQKIEILCNAPEKPGEYKLTLKVEPLPGEANADNNEISTFVQVVKEKINVLWIDRPRVWESTFARLLALGPEQRFEVYYFEPPTLSKDVDPLKFYEFDQRHYDVIIIGDLSAKRAALGQPERIFPRINEMVLTQKTGLLMLGGSETFVKGDWHKEKAILSMLPVKLDVDPAKADLDETPTPARPTKEGLNLPFLKLDPDPVKNEQIWKDFDYLEGLAPVGSAVNDNARILEGKNNKLIMAATKFGAGHVAVLASDSTVESWRTPKTIDAYKRFWKQLVFWLAQQQDLSNQLWIKLDRRRVNANTGEVLGFRFGLRGKTNDELAADFTARIVGPKDALFPVIFHPVAKATGTPQHQAGSFKPTKEGDYELRVTGKAKEGSIDVEGSNSARFLVALDDVEMMRPLAEHEALTRLAVEGEGRFQVLSEQTLLQYLDELQGQVNRESRHKTTHWPDWKRLPASEQARDQLAGLWHSFALVSLLAFVTLIGGEWFLRRWWGLV